MSTIQDEKKALRTHILAARRKLSSKQRQQRSARIAERIIVEIRTTATFLERQSLSILSYMSVADEVDVQAVHEWCIEHGHRLVVPRVDVSEPGKLQLLQIDEHTNWTINRFGIREPVGKNVTIVSDEQIEVVIVPGVAYDVVGTRLGFGGGYYDRLKDRLLNAQLIAPAFELQLCDTVPAEAHDLKVHKIVTEKRVVDTGKDR